MSGPPQDGASGSPGTCLSHSRAARGVRVRKGKQEEARGEGRSRRAVAWLHIACSLATALSRGEAVCEKHETDTSEG